VHEIGFPVIPHSPGFHLSADIPQRFRLATGNTDVDGFSLHMEAVPGDSLAPLAEHGVGLGGTVPGNNMVLRSIAQFVCESIEEVQQVPVDGLYFSGVVISKNIIDFVQGFRMIVAVGIITDVQGFMGMRVIEMEHATAAWAPIFKNCRRLQSMFQQMLIFRKNDKVFK